MKKFLFIIIVVLISPLWGDGRGVAQLCFGSSTNYVVSASSSFYSNSICNADFNGDGKIDLAGIYASNVSVLLGNGAGSFGPLTSFTISGSPSYIMSTDLNGDGKADLATANIGSNNVSILLGTGTGAFGASTSFTVGTGPESVCSADFNGDGFKDLATANYSANSISILFGTGTGNFGSATTFTVGSNPGSIISADFNSDSKPDLAIAHSTIPGKVSVLLGMGTGSFGAITYFAVDSLPVALISADFNGDGKIDLATANDGAGSNNISVLLGTGTGSFGTAVNFAVGNGPWTITSADFNGDGKIDIATANDGQFSYSLVSVLLGTGTGSFGSATTFTTCPNAYSIINADFNNDSKPDLAMVNEDSNFVSVLLNCNTVGISNFAYEQAITAYPNPTSESVSLNIENVSNLQNSSITIQNTLGQTVKTIPFIKNINVSDLAEGYYFLQITLSGGETYKAKFIKQ